MTIKNITSGTGFGSMIPYNNAAVGTVNQGSASDIGYNYKPTARWTEPPCSLYRENHVVGLLSFHSDGIKEVDFVLNGGTTVTVTQPEYNVNTNLNEWCVRLNRDDIVNVRGENFNNVELRAIVRPNIGLPRVMQHDIAGISGSDATKILGFKGISGGFSNPTAGPSGDGYLFAGEHSHLATMFSDNSSSTKKDIEVFLSPVGFDTNTGLTRSSPVKTMDKVVEVLQTQFKADPNPAIGTWDGAGNNDQYIDRAIITLLAGTYDETNINYSVSNPTFKLSNLYTYLVVRGDPDPTVPVEDIEITVTDGNLPRLNAIFNLTEFKAINLIKFDKLFFNRTKHKEHGKTNGGVRCARGKRDTGAVIDGNIYPNFVNTWFNKLKVVTPVFSAEGEADFMGANSDTPLGGPNFTNCYFEGGTAISKGCMGLNLNTKVFRQGEDQSFGSFPLIGLEVEEHTTSIALTRRIIFPAGSGYEQFNGYYITRSGKNIALLEDNLLNDGGKNPSGFAIWNKGILGTVMRKINEEAWMGSGAAEGYPRISLPLSTNLVEQVPVPDDYFVWKDEPDSPESPLETRISYRKGSVPVDASLYQKGASNISVHDEDWENHYFENKYMAALYSLDTGSGISAAGYALFDAEKPLVYGTGTNKQKYLYRHAGTTGAINGGRSGLISNEASFFSNQATSEKGYNYGWAEGVGTQVDNDGNNTVLATSTKCPQFGVGTVAGGPSINTTANPSGGSTIDSHPIECEAWNGSEDGEHGDIMQWFTLGTNDQYERPENIIVAYNRLHHGKIQTALIEQKKRSLPARDISFVNNYFAQGPYNRAPSEISKSTATFGASGTAFNNLLFEHNTILNDAPSFSGSGSTAKAGFDGDSVVFMQSGWCFRNNIFDGGLNDAFTEVDDANGNPVTPTFVASSTTFPNGQFSVADTRSESNIVYQWKDQFPAPGGPKDYVFALLDKNSDYREHGLTGFAMADPDRDFNINFDTYTSPACEYVAERQVPDYVGNFTIIPHEGADDNISPLIAGATNSSVYDDINRVRRQTRATVGAIEYIRPVVGSSDFSITSTGINTTETTFTLSDLNISDFDEVYGKKIFVKAFHDGSEVLSSNGINFANYYTYQENVDNAGDGVVDPNTSDDDELTHRMIGVSSNGSLGKYPEQLEYIYEFDEFGEVDSPIVNDWLPNAYGVTELTFFSSAYLSLPHKNFVNFQFRSIESRNKFDEDINNNETEPIVFTFQSGFTAGLSGPSKVGGLGDFGLKYYIMNETGTTVDIDPNYYGGNGIISDLTVSNDRNNKPSWVLD